MRGRAADVQASVPPPPAPSWGCIVALAIVSPLSAVVVYLVVRGILGDSSQQLYMLWVGVPRLISYVTALPLGFWLLIRSRRGGKVPGFQCICWWMLVQGGFMIYNNIRGLDLHEEQYDGAEREYRFTYLTLQLVGTVPDLLLGLLWLMLLYRQDGGSAICCWKQIALDTAGDTSV